MFLCIYVRDHVIIQMISSLGMPGGINMGIITMLRFIIHTKNTIRINF